VTDQAAIPMIVMTRSQDHVESINRTLRNVGLPVHCTWLPDARDLDDAMNQINPEMLIAFLDDLGIDLATIVAARGRSIANLPIVVVRERVDEPIIAEAMKTGANDAVTLASIERLQFVVARELRAYRHERALNSTLSSAREYRDQLQNFLEGSADAITHVQEGIIVDANSAWTELFGHSSEEELTGTPLMDLFEQESHPVLKGALTACLQGKWTDYALKVKAAFSDGSGMPLELMLARTDHDNEPAVRIWVPARQREDRDLETRLNEAVKNDATTGFLQQRYLIEALRARGTVAMKGGVRQIVYIEPDRYDALRESVGVLRTEEFMSQLADLLRHQLTPTDVVGRFGGTGIMLMLERGTARDVETWARNMVKHVDQNEFMIGQKRVAATITAGLGPLAGPNPDIDAAVLDAFNANRRGQDLGGNQMYVVEKVTADTSMQANDKIWVKYIKSALMENRFRLVQQPIASLMGQDKGMFDVLVRMIDENENEVLPAEFIRAAERNDLMKNIDRWVIGASIAFSASRKSECIFLRVSKDTVLDKTLLPWLESQLRAVRIEPKRLCFQVSEELASHHLRQTKELAQQLAKLGFRFAIEHFGTGRDPLHLLTEIDAHFIKIDGSLMQGLSTNQVQQQRVRGLVEAAKRKKMETIAERVEDANTMAVLWQLGIEFIQGYFVNAPEDVTLSAER
jgi:PAS domain S-box-containing protein/diguanylate cyclase (GGDEF)-like protein